MAKKKAPDLSVDLSQLSGAALEAHLRTFLLYLNIKWQPCYKKLSDAERRALVLNMRPRVSESQCRLGVDVLNQHAEGNVKSPGKVTSAFQHTTGGGKRVFRSSKGLGS